MTIILDENLPRPLKRIFPNHTVTTVQEEGFAGTVNGALLARLEGVFDVFITADRNLRYQQNLSGRQLAILDFPRIGARCSGRCSRGSQRQPMR